MTEVLEMIDTDVNAVDVHELIDAELDTVSGGYNWYAQLATREQLSWFTPIPSGMTW
jgi:hypothetical protein